MYSKTSSSKSKKQVRKPVGDKYAPKRLAINFQPPTIIIEYLVVDTGKLYHHKIRLDSIFRKKNASRVEVMNYIKTKHHLYFLNGKIKDEQLLKFIDKILKKVNKTVDNSSQLKEIKEEAINVEGKSRQGSQFCQDDDFDYLNDDEEYQEDYQDYQYEEEKEGTNQTAKGGPTIVQPQGNKATQPAASNLNKNTFMTYCQEYEESNDEEGQAQWDLDMDQNADFV